MSEEDKANESLARTSLVEAVGIITLVGPTQEMLRRGMQFEGYLRNRGGAIRYVFATSVFAATGLKFGKDVDRDSEQSSDPLPVLHQSWFDPDTWLEAINHFIQRIAPTGLDLRWDVSDVLPYVYFLFALAMGAFNHGAFLAGRRFIPESMAKWLRARPRALPFAPFPNAIAAIRYGLGFFLLLYAGQAIVLFVSNRLFAAHPGGNGVCPFSWLVSRRRPGILDISGRMCQ